MRNTVCIWTISVLASLTLSALAGEKWALVIGVDKCKALGELKVCAADARAVGDLLKQAGYHVSLLADDSAELSNWPTIGNVERGVESVARVAEKGDTILMFFSGHGVTKDDEGYLVPADGDRDKAVALSWVKQKLSASAASRKLMILDACHSGAAKGVNGIAVSHRARSDLAMLLSCAKKQVSWPDERRGHSVFTWYLLEGLRGGAAGADREVTQRELFDYVHRRVKAWTFSSKKKLQTPVMVDEGLSDMALATVPSGGFKVAPRPPTPVTRVSLPTKLALACEIPATSKDQHGNPVLRGTGEKTKLPREIWHKQTGMEFALIEPGEFEMGSKLSAKQVAEKFGGKESDVTNEHPQHTVRITKPFYLGKYEVTVGQFRRFVEAKFYRTEAETDGGAYVFTGTVWQKKEGASWKEPGFTQVASHPVVCVSWNDAKAFCDWAGASPPAEAEWEYACRAGTATLFPWGDLPVGAARWANIADNTYRRAFPEDELTFKNEDDSYAHTAPVGRYRPNAWGLYDVIGNAGEWCHDWYDEEYYAKRVAEDLRGPADGKYRVLRGGSWLSYPYFCRTAYRYWLFPSTRLFFIGFRLVLRDF